MIQAVIFDMDGVLIDSEPLWKRAHTKAFRQVGIEFNDDHHRLMLGKRTHDAIRHVRRHHPWERGSTGKVEAATIKEIIRLIKQEGTLKPGVLNALDVCKKAGLPVAIASSSRPDVIDAVVDTLEIRAHFKHIHSAEYEEYGKPHPAVFLSVAKQFKVDPQDCLVFEDSPAGVIAAKAAQMRCVAVPEAESEGHPFLGAADMVLGSLEEFDEAKLRSLGPHQA
jgi:HAD superfamily hydrolase (TIGR01509 family)